MVKRHRRITVLGDYAGTAAGRERIGKGSIFAEDGACSDAKKTASARSSFLSGTERRLKKEKERGNVALGLCR
ncbi:hypothetical protein D3Z60_02260 [Lachnospiraceae bacterium]|nr:hypothetical protein [Lachnospiraceae bacterium]